MHTQIPKFDAQIGKYKFRARASSDVASLTPPSMSAQRRWRSTKKMRRSDSARIQIIKKPMPRQRETSIRVAAMAARKVVEEAAISEEKAGTAAVAAAMSAQGESREEAEEQQHPVQVQQPLFFDHEDVLHMLANSYLRPPSVLALVSSCKSLWSVKAVPLRMDTIPPRKNLKNWEVFVQLQSHYKLIGLKLIMTEPPANYRLALHQIAKSGVSLHTLSLHLIKGNWTEMTPLAKLTSLRHLTINDCSGMADLAALAKLTSLKTLELSGWSRTKLGVADVAALGQFPSLEALILKDCPNLRDVAALGQLTSLKELTLKDCPNMRQVAALGQLTSLKELTLLNCNGMTDLAAALVQLTSLERVKLNWPGSCIGNPDYITFDTAAAAAAWWQAAGTWGQHH